MNFNTTDNLWEVHLKKIINKIYDQNLNSIDIYNYLYI